MANSQRTVRVLLLFMVISFMVRGISGGRLSPGVSAAQIQPGGGPRLTWLEFGLDEAKLEYYRRRKILDAATMRMAPGGPDPQHHSRPPALPKLSLQFKLESD